MRDTSGIDDFSWPVMKVDARLPYKAGSYFYMAGGASAMIN